MSLATYAQANTHLDGTKIAFDNEEEAAPIADVADKTVKGMIARLYTDYFENWTSDTTPTLPQETTPEIIALAASYLMASYLYSEKYSEETLDGNDYAARLEARAMVILNGLLNKTFTLYDKPDYVLIESLSGSSFYPNDTTLVTADDDFTGLSEGDEVRLFTLGRVF